MTNLRKIAIGGLTVGLGILGIIYLPALPNLPWVRSAPRSLPARENGASPARPSPPAVAAGAGIGAAARATPGVILAAPGRVEGLSDTTEVAAAANGILKAVYVQEGQLVTRGTVLGEIGCDDLKSALQGAIAEADGARQAQLRLLRGARKDEKKVASEKTAAAQAVLNQTKAERDRMQNLYQKQDVSRADWEQAVRDFEVAEANLQAAVNSEQLVDEPALEEEKAKAQDDVFAAGWHVKMLRDEIAKCSIVAPMDGAILRVYARPGESFSIVTPRPLFILADASGRRIRAEVDEADVNRVAVGQNVVIEADALQGKKLYGSVTSLSSMMGRKNIETGDPAAKSDRDILEAWIAYSDDSPRPLPIGLRVTVQFLSDTSSQTSEDLPQEIAPRK